MRSPRTGAPPGDLAAYFLLETAAPTLESLLEKLDPAPAPYPETPAASLELARFVLARLGLPLDDVLASAVLAGCSAETLNYFSQAHSAPLTDQMVVVLERAAEGKRKQRPATATSLRGAQRTRMGGSRRRPSSAAV